MSTSYPKTSVPTGAELHLMNRMGCGYSRSTFGELRQLGLLESMVDLWSNHLHVPASGHLGWTHRYHYDLAIREHALGRFDDLLAAATLHPAMLLYLDNWRSTRNAPNENHGRELLELHTVGRTSGYTEQMVKDSAKILSGYTVDAKATWVGSYDTSLHTTGRVQVLGFVADNASVDGSQMTRDYLRYLAHHPATARTIARKLAVRFVSDTPSDPLVGHLAEVFLDSGTDITTTLRALVASSEFQQSAGRKVRTAIEDLVATCRVMQIQATRPTRSTSFATAIAWVHQSMLLYHGDLKVTTDHRDVLGEIVTRRFPERSVSTVFPGLSHRPLGLMR